MVKVPTKKPPENFKNFTRPNAKPSNSHSVFQEKVWTLPELIYKKIRIIADLLESLHSKLTESSSKNIKSASENNLKILIKDLDVIQKGLKRNPSSFKTDNLKTNLKCINEMKHVCNALQLHSAYKSEFQNLGHIKHELHELEHLVQPTIYEKSAEKIIEIGKLDKTTTKEENKKTINQKPKVKSMNKLSTSKTVKKPVAKTTPIKVASKKPVAKKAVSKAKPVVKKATKPVAKVTKPKKVVSKLVVKAKTAVSTVKHAVKKIAKPKAKVAVKKIFKPVVKHPVKKTITSKPKPKIKSAIKQKKK